MNKPHQLCDWTLSALTLISKLSPEFLDFWWHLLCLSALTLKQTQDHFQAIENDS